VQELYKGACCPSKSEAAFEKVKKQLTAFVILTIDEDACDLFGELSAELRRRGEAIGDFDELIASIALSILSGDSHFRRVPGLKALFL
jgi:predicted nucleic acid-binding protein